MRRIVLGGTIVIIAIAVILVLFWDSSDDAVERLPRPTGESREPLESKDAVADEIGVPRRQELEAGLGAALGGIVVDAEEHPISDAEVYAWLKGGTKDQPGVAWRSATVLSDGEGRFSVSVPAATVTYFVYVQKEPYECGRAKATVPPEGIDDVHIVLYPQCSISGKVLSHDGRTQSNVVIAACSGLSEPDSKSTGRLIHSKPSGDDGSFEVHGLARGYCRLHATAAKLGRDGTLTGSTRYQADGSLDAEPLLTLELARGERREGAVVRLTPVETEQFIQGQIVSLDSQPLSDARVWVTSGPEGNRSKPIFVTGTDAEGYFLIQGEKVAQPGAPERTASVYVHASHDKYEDAFAPDVPWNTEDLVLSMVPRTRGSITGLVLERTTRKPVEQAAVNLWQIDTQWGDRIRFDLTDLLNLEESKAVRTDAEGGFQLRDVPAGAVILQITHPRYGVSWHRPEIRVAPGESAVMEILLDEPGTLDVRAVYRASPGQGKFWSYLDLVPLDILNEKDLLPNRFTYGNLEQRGRPPVTGETFAGHTMFKVSVQLSSIEPWKPLADNEFRGLQALPPGNYRILSGSFWKAGREYRQCTHYVSKNVVIRSGKTTSAHFELGGDSVVRVLPNLDDGDGKQLILVMADPGQISELDNHEFPSRTSMRPIIQTSVDTSYFFDAPVGTAFEFENILAGKYSLRAYECDEAEGVVRLLTEQAIDVEAGMEYEVALP